MNQWRIGEALASTRRLSNIIGQMTAEEIVKAIALEENSSRRSSILERLYRQSRVLARNLHQASLPTQIAQSIQS